MPITLVYNTNLVSGQYCAWTVPSGVSSVTFELWGGGGGGAATSTTCDCCARAMSGGGGGYSMVTIPVTGGDTYIVCAANGGCTGSGTGWGSEESFNSNGYNGGTSFISGTNLSNFCAGPGVGGCLSGLGNCYRACGCNSQHGGMGYGGQLMQCGGKAVQGSLGTNAFSSWTMGGQGAGPGGGVGGFNNGGYNNSVCTASHGAASGDNPYLWGVFPGGGGAGAGASCCACCNRPGGRGAAGLAKITW